MSGTPLLLTPTLWRTCRALANRRRLGILRRFVERQELSVSEIVRQVGIAQPLASEYLRALNARGLLEARRVGRAVLYRLKGDPAVPQADALVGALRTTFRKPRCPIDDAFAALTGFTHPRRIALVQALAHQPLALKTIRKRTGIPRRAALRHLAKLMCRGYVVMMNGLYQCAAPPSPLGRALLALALKA